MDAERIISDHDRERRLRLMWWIVSIILHGVVIGALIWWTGLREWVFASTTKAPAPTSSRSALAAAAEALTGIFAPKLRQAGDGMAAIAIEIAGHADKRVATLAVEDARLLDITPAPLATPASAAADADVITLYRWALANERACELAYERLRAVDLAALQRLPLSRALVVSAMPGDSHARPALDQTLFVAPPTTNQALEAFRKELIAGHLEAQAALAASERLRSLARRVMGLETATDLVVADLTGTQADATHVQFFEDAEYVGAKLFPTDKVEDGGVNTLDARPVLGTTIGDRYRAADWLALDAWWIVGPFEHPGSARPEQLDRVYPPEGRPGLKVDLDEVYAGKGGRTLRWLWHQSPTVRINPLQVQGAPVADNETYAIWYAWTEVWCDKPRKAWAAFGSDDFSAAWLNGELVYQSGRSPQAWQPFKPDAFRQVTLAAGLNRFLVKLENKGGLTAFSVCINLDENL